MGSTGVNSASIPGVTFTYTTTGSEKRGRGRPKKETVDNHA